jgi:hypothetical protein
MAEISPDMFYEIVAPLRGELVQSTIVRKAIREDPFLAWIGSSFADGQVPDAEIYWQGIEKTKDRYAEWGDYDDYLDAMTASIAGQAIMARHRQQRNAKGDI